MDTFGATLRTEREERGLTLETVAALIGIERASLEALERDEFDALPDRAAMLAGLAAYAECLQVDAEMMIEHYERERERCLGRLAESVTETRAQVAPPAATTAASVPRRSFPYLLVISACVALFASVVAWRTFRVDGAPAPAAQISKPAELAAPTPATAPTAAISPRSNPVTAPATTRPAAPDPRAGAGAGIPEFGVGTGVRNRRLVGRGDRFAAGSQVWFWTRVEGGNPGDTIDHVWFHEGVETARIPLEIGGSRWRTQSAKTLRSPGSWAVEARDGGGRVLARVEFDCFR